MTLSWVAIKGSSWANWSVDARTSIRSGVQPSGGNVGLGVRCARGARRFVLTRSLHEKVLMVCCGGSWIDRVQSLRASFRYRDEPSYLVGDIGFRCARRS